MVSWTNEVVQTDNQRKFERLIRKPTDQIEHRAKLSWRRLSNAGLHAATAVPDDVGCSCGKCNDTINDEFNDSGGGD